MAVYSAICLASTTTNNRCLDCGIDYLFEEAVRGVDHGPPINKDT